MKRCLLLPCCVALACGEQSRPPLGDETTNSPDAGPLSSEQRDATTPIGGASEDAALEPDPPKADAGDPPWAPPEVSLPDPESGDELWLSEVGLYRDIQNKVPAPDLIHFEPDSPLWTDGAKKERWMRLPAGTQIDTSDMDNWSFPIGTMFFKQFSRDGKRIETRLIARTGAGRFDYWMGPFIWNDDESDARFTPDGAENARGTEHDVPNVTKCGSCHNGAPGRILGMAAVQQSVGNGEIGLQWLREQGLLSDPPPEGASYAPPGDEVTAQAIGYLHANCGHCHTSTGAAWPDTNLSLKFEATQRTPEETNLYTSAIGVELQFFSEDGVEFRVLPGDPEASALFYRMNERGTRTQMPTIGTELADPEGLDIVERWILSLDP